MVFMHVIFTASAYISEISSPTLDSIADGDPVITESTNIRFLQREVSE